MVHASFAARRDGIGPRPTDETGSRAHGHRLDDVESAADPAVHQDLALVAHSLGDVRQRADRGAHVSSWRPPWFPTMTASAPWSRRRSGVVGVQDALQRDLAAPVLAQPREVVPGHAGIELSGDPRLEVTGDVRVGQRLLEVPERERSTTDRDVAHPLGVREEVGAPSCTTSRARSCR